MVHKLLTKMLSSNQIARFFDQQHFFLFFECIIDQRKLAFEATTLFWGVWLTQYTQTCLDLPRTPLGSLGGIRT